MKQQDKVILVVGSTTILVGAGLTGAWLFGKSDAPATTSAIPSTAQTANTSAASSAANTSTVSGSSTSSTSGYTDGTYTATINYVVPHGYSNQLTATVTIGGGQVTSVSVQHDTSDQESNAYTDSFDAVLQDNIVGKSIDGLSPSRIGGASLTTQAFDDALVTIRTDAKA